MDRHGHGHGHGHGLGETIFAAVLAVLAGCSDSAGFAGADGGTDTDGDVDSDGDTDTDTDTDTDGDADGGTDASTDTDGDNDSDADGGVDTETEEPVCPFDCFYEPGICDLYGGIVHDDYVCPSEGYECCDMSPTCQGHGYWCTYLETAENMGWTVYDLPGCASYEVCAHFDPAEDEIGCDDPETPDDEYWHYINCVDVPVTCDEVGDYGCCLHGTVYWCTYSDEEVHSVHCPDLDPAMVCCDSSWGMTCVEPF